MKLCGTLFTPVSGRKGLLLLPEFHNLRTTAVMHMNDYEKNALAVINTWENPEPTIWSKVSDTVGKPFSLAGDAVMKVPGVQLVLSKSVDGIMSVCGDAAAITVRTSAIFKEFCSAGYEVSTHEHIREVPLEIIDRVVGYLDAKYKGLALTEGVITGVAGAPGIIADIPALSALTLRAVFEYATYYGFDISLQEERAYALEVLAYAATPVSAKSAVMIDLARIGSAAARKKTWDEISKTGLSTLIVNVAKQLGYRLTKAKLAQVVPYIGSVVAGGFNAKYTADVCESAYYLYRKRFLERKYDIVTVENGE